MASTMRLMKGKKSALGDNDIPSIQRVYLEVVALPGDGSGLAATKSLIPSFVFVDKRWTVGKMIDKILMKLGIKVNNCWLIVCF